MKVLFTLIEPLLGLVLLDIGYSVLRYEVCDVKSGYWDVLENRRIVPIAISTI
jgi:hypothetical protein